MKLIALENTPVDYTANVKDDFIYAYNLQKGQFNSIDAKQMALFEKVLAASRSPGGSAANVCHGFSNLGMESAFIGSIGDDEAGSYYAGELQKAGVIPYLETKKGPTGKCMTLITYDKERTFAMNMGKSSSLLPREFNPSHIATSGIFHTTAYALDSMYRTVKRAMKIAKKNQVKISFDLASVISIRRHMRRIRHLLENYVDIVFANEEEAMAFTGAGSPDLTLDILAANGKTAVVKLGPKGAMAKGPSGWSAMCDSYKVFQVRNTNGAGDAFAAGFLYGVAKGFSLAKRIKAGAFYASKVVEVESARLPYRISNIEDLI
ncbi:MAG: adenosine kinase [Nanoarchaeota archaeon]